MKKTDRDQFDGRLKNASVAKRTRLERFQAAADDPERLAERARRDEVAIARAAKQHAKAAKLLKEKEDLTRQQSEDAIRREAQTSLREAEIKAELAQTADQVIAQTAEREAERKAERDRRYAARQNRKR
ncbi:MAG: DUF6481 family protein [Roseovarius sp.]